MKIYMVGGAVRDTLLGRPVKERDFVVVGATPQDMLARGFHQVGRDFPVFLHPDTKEEYALARGERRRVELDRDPGTFTQPDVTLEQDLERRDLTVNAIAMDADGEVIDPYGGRLDLDNKLLRHVSGAFSDDPVSILRVARFAARYGEMGFRVARETMALMARMVKRGDADALVPERVWQELARALVEPRPCRFFEVLRGCGAWSRLFPEIPDDGRAITALEQVVPLSWSSEIRFAAIMGSLNPVTTGEVGHPGDGASAIRDVESLCTRLRAPRRYHELALLVVKYCQRVPEAASAEAILALFEATDAMRRPDRFRQFLLSCRAICGDHSISRQTAFGRDSLLTAALERVNRMDLLSLVTGIQDPDRIKDIIQQRRIEVIHQEATRITGEDMEAENGGGGS